MEKKIEKEGVGFVHDSGQFLELKRRAKKNKVEREVERNNRK